MEQCQIGLRSRSERRLNCCFCSLRGNSRGLWRSNDLGWQTSLAPNRTIFRTRDHDRRWTLERIVSSDSTIFRDEKGIRRRIRPLAAIRNGPTDLEVFDTSLLRFSSISPEEAMLVGLKPKYCDQSGPVPACGPAKCFEAPVPSRSRHPDS
jgi:hypothetical protein